MRTENPRVGGSIPPLTLFILYKEAPSRDSLCDRIKSRLAATRDFEVWFNTPSETAPGIGSLPELAAGVAAAVVSKRSCYSHPDRVGEQWRTRRRDEVDHPHQCQEHNRADHG